MATDRSQGIAEPLAGADMRILAALPALLAALAGGPCDAGSVDLPLQISGAYSVPVTSIQEARFRATMRQKYDFSCGSAALSTLLTYQYQYPVTEQVVFEEMFQHGDRQKIQSEGFSLLDMKRYLEAHGFEANGFEATLDKLETVGIPAIVLVKEHGYNHFVVIKGVRDGRVLVGDPAAGTRSMPQAAFKAVWLNKILFVIGNKRNLARFNLASDWQAAPNAPLVAAGSRHGLTDLALPKLGPSDF